MENQPDETTEAINQPEDGVVDEKGKKKREYFFKPGHPGHPKGGRPKKVSSKLWAAREIAEEMDFNPMIEAIKIFRTGKLPAAPGVKAQPVSATSRVRCLEQALAFLLPRLSHAAISGPEGAPIAVAQLQIDAILADPALARMAQTLSLNLSGYPTAAPKQLEAAPENDETR